MLDATSPLRKRARRDMSARPHSDNAHPLRHISSKGVWCELRRGLASAAARLNAAAAPGTTARGRIFSCVRVMGSGDEWRCGWRVRQHQLGRMGLRPAGEAKRFSSVSGAWTQPAATCSRGRTYSAVWVGLGGYSASELEQIGTDANCSSSNRASYGSWYELVPAAPAHLTLTGPSR